MSFMQVTYVDIFPAQVSKSPRQGASCDFGLLEELASKFAKDSFFGTAQATWSGKKRPPFLGDGRLGRCGLLKFGGILMNVVECLEKCWDFWYVGEDERKKNQLMFVFWLG